MNKLLLPDGNILSPHEIKKLNIKQIFNLLIKLNVATKTQLNTHIKSKSSKRTSRRTSRRASRRSSRRTSRRIRRHRRSESPDGIIRYYPMKYRSPERKRLYGDICIEKKYDINNTIPCTNYRSKNTCPVNRCYWTSNDQYDGSCLTR